MKKLFTTLIILIFTVYYSLLTVQAQAPQKMSYQAVIRNASGLLVTNHGIGMQISILKGSGLAPVYVETQSATTNANGLVTIVIGDGTVVSGSFATIDWSADNYSIKTETDPTSAGGSSYTITGVSQLLSVPYALNAKTAENAFSGNYNDLTNRPTLFNGQYGSLSGTPTLATIATSGSYTDLINQPSLFSGLYSDLSGKPALWDSTWVSIKNKPNFFDGQYSSLTGAPTNVSNFTNDAGYLTSYTESDPKVGANTSGFCPKWNGSALVTGAIFQDASGRIGIGKTSPQTTLDITSTNTTDAVIRLKNYNDPIGAVIINTYNAVQFGMFNPGSSALNLVPAGSGRSFFGFDPTGKVGSLTNYYLINVYRNLLDDGSGNAFFTGNVGVGNSTPAYKLDVSGDINTTGAFKINGTALATVASSGSYTDLTNKPTVDGSETKVTAGTNVSVTGTGTSASPYVINTTAHYIGESYGGGIVFYVYDNGQHGLIAASADQSTGMQWYNGSNTTTNAVRDGIGAGKLNTERIIANQSTGNYAAQLCSNYQGGNFGDWYLPSKYELNLLYLERSVVGGFTSANYWCSTEYNATYSYYQNFGSQGYQTYTTKDYSSFYIRAIRAF